MEVVTQAHTASPYPKGSNDRPPIPADVLLRIYFIQQWYAPSNPTMEDSLYDMEAMHEFAGIDLDRTPDETMICKFRHCLEHDWLTEKLFAVVTAYLDEGGLLA